VEVALGCHTGDLPLGEGPATVGFAPYLAGAGQLLHARGAEVQTARGLVGREVAAPHAGGCRRLGSGRGARCRFGERGTQLRG